MLAADLPLTLVPLDVTRQVAADDAWCASLSAASGAVPHAAAAIVQAYLANIAALRKEGMKAAGAPGPLHFPLHDPCVVLYAIAPTMFRIERLALRVITDGSERDGATILDTGGHAADVLTGADTGRALALAAERLGASMPA